MKKLILYILISVCLVVPTFPVSADLVLVLQSKQFVKNEPVVGVKNGVNTSFSVAVAPVPSRSLELFVNGIKQDFGTHYTIVGTSLTILEAPESGDTLTVNYEYNQ